MRNTLRILPLGLAVLVAAGCESTDSPTAPEIAETGGSSALIETGAGITVMSVTDGEIVTGASVPMMSAMSGSSDGTSAVYSSIGDLTWPSLSYQATQTEESGDYIAVARPGVLSHVDVGMSSWACQSGGWNTEDCQTAEGATFTHPITLNLYAVDYSGATAGPGDLITSVTQDFDLPYRPSAESECTGDDEGKFFDARFGRCVNGLNTEITFDLSGMDVVVPAEVMVGVEYNTQSYGPNPIGSSGPYNSLNVGLAVESPTIGTSVFDDDLLWEAPVRGVPFDLYQFSEGSFPYRTALSLHTEPNAGFVTGGGWFTSPEGAMEFSDAVWVQDFSVDDTGWLDSDDGWVGAITVADGTATFEGAEVVDPTEDFAYGPFSRFDGYRDVWPGTYTAEVDVYLDPAWATGEGFDYSVASSGADGNHQRDFIFHVGVVEDSGPVVGKALLVNGSNNTDFTTNPFKLTNDNGGDFYEVTTAGWYTLQHVFRDAGGYLAVDLNLLDANGNVLWTATRENTGDLIPSEVGGNRYSWFTHIEVSGGIDVDNHELFLTEGSAEGRASFGFVSRYKKGANVPTGNTQFTFKDGGLDFHSTSYDWLVVNQGDSNAQFKGEGTVNGGGAYKFMLWAGDHDTGDTFRIKIWEDVGGTESVLYDNGTDQPIEGGQIVIHGEKGGKKK